MVALLSFQLKQNTADNEGTPAAGTQEILGNMQSIVHVLCRNALNEYLNVDLRLKHTEPDHHTIDYTLKFTNATTNLISNTDVSSQTTGVKDSAASDFNKYQLIAPTISPSSDNETNKQLSSTEIAGNNVTLQIKSSHPFGNAVTLRAYKNSVSDENKLSVWSDPADPAAAKSDSYVASVSISSPYNFSEDLVLNDLFDQDNSVTQMFITLQISTTNSSNEDDDRRDYNHLQTDGEVPIIKLTRNDGVTPVGQFQLINLQNGWTMFSRINDDGGVNNGKSQLVFSHDGVEQSVLTTTN